MNRRARSRPRRRKPGRPGRSVRATPTAPRRDDLEELTEIVGLADEVARHPESGPTLTGGDVDADWVGAYATGEEAVGGSVSTPDQDIVDEIGQALGVEQPPDGEVQVSEEILRRRDRFRWHLEREAADREEGRPPHRHRGAI